MEVKNLMSSLVERVEVQAEEERDEEEELKVILPKTIQTDKTSIVESAVRHVHIIDANEISEGESEEIKVEKIMSYGPQLALYEEIDDRLVLEMVCFFHIHQPIHPS